MNTYYTFVCMLIHLMWCSCLGCKKKSLCAYIYVAACLMSHVCLSPLSVTPVSFSWRWIAFSVSNVHPLPYNELIFVDGLVCVSVCLSDSPASTTECVCLCLCQVCTLPALAHWHHPACPHHGKYRLSHSPCVLLRDFLSLTTLFKLSTAINNALCLSVDASGHMCEGCVCIKTLNVPFYKQNIWQEKVCLSNFHTFSPSSWIGHLSWTDVFHLLQPYLSKCVPQFGNGIN